MSSSDSSISSESVKLNSLIESLYAMRNLPITTESVVYEKEVYKEVADLVVAGVQFNTRRVSKHWCMAFTAVAIKTNIPGKNVTMYASGKRACSQIKEYIVKLLTRIEMKFEDHSIAFAVKPIEQQSSSS